MSTKVLSGIQEVRASFRLLDAGLQARLRAAVAATTSEVKAGAMARVPVSGPGSRKGKNRPGPGELRDTIRGEMSANGFTGYVKAGYGKLGRSSRAKAPKSAGQARRQRALRARSRSLASRGIGQYAMVIEYGSPHEGKAAQPYMRPARQAAAAGHEARMQHALNDAVTAAGGNSV